MQQGMTAILPSSNLESAQAFFGRLGFSRLGGPDDYRILADGLGGLVYLAPAVAGWLTPGRNPFGLYLYRQDVDALAAAFEGEILEKEGPCDRPWGMCEFFLNGPDDVLVRVGWPAPVRR